MPRHSHSAALSRRQTKFVAEYLVDLNATQAAIRAGYSRKTAHVIGYENLGKPRIKAAVDAGHGRALEAVGVSRVRVLRELAAVGMADIRKCYDERGNLLAIDQLDDATAASIAGVDIEELYERNDDGVRVNTGRVRKIKRFDKTKALELLGRHLGLWTDPAPPAAEGPGLTVIVQNGVQVDGHRVTSSARVMVNLPQPEYLPMTE